MAITPIPGVGGKKTGRYAELLHPCYLVFTRHLRVYENHAWIGNRVRFLGGLKRIQDILNGFIPVAVNRYLVTGLVQRLHLGE